MEFSVKKPINIFEVVPKYSVMSTSELLLLWRLAPTFLSFGTKLTWEPSQRFGVPQIFDYHYSAELRQLPEIHPVCVFNKPRKGTQKCAENHLVMWSLLYFCSMNNQTHCSLWWILIVTGPIYAWSSSASFCSQFLYFEKNFSPLLSY